MGSAEESFFLYALRVRQVCSVDMLSVPNPRRFGVDVFLRAVTDKAGREGRRVIRDFGLGGGLLVRLSADGRRDGVFSTITLLLGLASKVPTGVLVIVLGAFRFSRDDRRCKVRGGDRRPAVADCGR